MIEGNEQHMNLTLHDVVTVKRANYDGCNQMGKKIEDTFLTMQKQQLLFLSTLFISFGYCLFHHHPGDTHFEIYN